MIVEELKSKGIFRIYSRNTKTNEVKKVGEINNLIMNDTLDTLINIYANTSPDLELKYLAIGDGNTAVSGSDETLDNEVFRTAYDTRTKTNTGEITSVFYILDSDYSGSIEEIGIFGGSTAGAGADSGTLIARVLWSYTKSASEELYITRIDRITA